MVWVRSPVYFYKRNETFYFSRAIPSDLLHRFNKRKIEVSLRTKSEAKAARSAAALFDRLERFHMISVVFYWVLFGLRQPLIAWLKNLLS